MTHAATPMFQNPALNDPRGTLTPHEIAVLREIDRDGPAIRRGLTRKWLLGERVHKDRTLRHFIQLGLAVEFYERPHVKLQLNYTGRTVCELLRTRPVPGAILSDD